MENNEVIQNFSEEFYDVKSLKKYVFYPIYCFSKKVGIPNFDNKDQKNDCRSKLTKILLFIIFLLPLIVTFIYHIIIGKKYTFLSLRNLENSLIGLYYIHAIIALLIYNNLKNTNFFINFIKHLKEYKEIHIIPSFSIERNFCKIKVKIFIFWLIFLVSFLYETILSFVDYEKNLSEDKQYKLSKFYGKSTYAIDALLLFYAKLIIVISATIYSCIYGTLNFEAEAFAKECQEFFDKTTVIHLENINVISLKHTKFFKLVTFSHQIVGKYTDLAIFNCTMIIVYGISVYRFYSSTASDTIYSMQYLLAILSVIYLEVILLLPICFMDKSLQNIKNIILNNPFLWDMKNNELHALALSMVTRSDHCEYHGLIMGLISLNDKTIPFLLIVVIILSSLLGTAVL
uniref:Gustatory receptor n=1 Tax=Strongyloides venezuelensis TaxID=75913 RepID=A0A0K0FS90_STRVS